MQLEKVKRKQQYSESLRQKQLLTWANKVCYSLQRVIYIYPLLSICRSSIAPMLSHDGVVVMVACGMGVIKLRWER